MISRSTKLKGFTLIELLVVIAIIGVLSTLAVIALGSARSKARDSKRLADIKQISTALELYYSENNTYPEIITPGNSLSSPDGLTDYMKKIPSNPTPRDDGDCPDADYGYYYITATNMYRLSGCIGSSMSQLIAGGFVLYPDSTIDDIGPTDGLVGYWDFNEGPNTVAIDYSGNKNDGTWNGRLPYYEAAKVGLYSGHFNLTNNPSKYSTDVNYVNVTSIPISTFANGFTWSTWLKTTRIDEDDWSWPLSASQTAGYYWWFQCGKKYDNDGDVRFETGNFTSNMVLDTDGEDIADNNWHHLTCIWDKKTAKNIYTLTV